jgi:O-antigen ligase
MKSLLLASGVAAIGASLIVGARGSWIALLILAILLLILFVKHTNTRKRITILLVSSALAISSAITMYPEKTSARYSAAVHNLTHFNQSESTQETDFKKTSTGARLVFWKSSIETFDNHPIFGSGSGDFKLELNQFIKNNPKYKALGVGVFGTAHNIYFEWLALFGGVGFIGLMIAAFFLPLQYFYREIKNNSQSLVPAIIGIWIVLSHLTFGLTETWIVRSAPNGVYVFYILLFMAFCHQPVKTSSRQPPSQ